MTTMLPSAALLLAAPLVAQDHDRLLTAVPEDACVVVSLASVDEIRARVADNAWWKLVQGDDFEPLLEHLEGMLTRRLDEDFEDDPELREAVDPRTWIRSVHGPGAAFLALDGDDELGGGGLFVEPGADAAAFDELWSAAVDRVRAKSNDSTQEYQGLELLFMEPREATGSLAIFFEVAGVRSLVIGEERAFVLELAQGAIDRMLGKDPSNGFRGCAALAEARGEAKDTPALEAFLDVSALVRLGVAEQRRKAAEVDAADTALMEKILERLGLSAMRYAHLTADAGADERVDLSFSIHLPSGSWFQGALACLRPAPRELFALLPQDSVQASVGSLDLAALWRLVRAAIAEIQPGADEQIAAGVTALESVLGASLEGDVLKQVTGDFAVADVPIPVDELSPEMAEELGAEGLTSSKMTVMLFRVEDGERIEALLARPLRTFGIAEMIEEEEYQGHTIQFLGEDGFGTYWSCTDEYFLISPTPTPVRAVLSRIGVPDAPSMLGDVRYGPVMQESADAVVLGLGDARATAESMLNMIRLIWNGAAEVQSEAAAQTFRELSALLPEASSIGKHIDGVICQSLVVRPERFTMRLAGR